MNVVLKSSNENKFDGAAKVLQCRSRVAALVASGVDLQAVTVPTKKVYCMLTGV